MIDINGNYEFQRFDNFIWCIRYCTNQYCSPCVLFSYGRPGTHVYGGSYFTDQHSNQVYSLNIGLFVVFIYGALRENKLLHLSIKFIGRIWFDHITLIVQSRMVTPHNVVLKNKKTVQVNSNKLEHACALHKALVATLAS